MVKTSDVVDSFRLRSAYSFSSVQCDLPPNVSKEIYEWGLKNIPDEYLDPDEKHARQEMDDVHITVKYGLFIVDPTEVRKHLYTQKPIEVTLGKISIFDGEENDCVKIEVQSDDLVKLNDMVKENFEHQNSFPTYIPHCTVAYVKKGLGSRFVGRDDFAGRKVVMTSVVFSGKDNRKTVMPLPT